jgi:hypothetical protein
MNGKTRQLLFVLALLAAGLAPVFPARAYDHRKVEAYWEKTKKEIENWGPDRVKEIKTWAESLRLVRVPENVMTSFDDDPALWKSATAFYDYIQNRELDVYQEQQGLPYFFPNRAAYYDFLDTMLPAMRDRRFEKNRILTYAIHGITVDFEDPQKAYLLMSATSDDTFPFGKVMVYHHTFLRSSRGWYPGKVSAESATFWEKVR